MGNKKRGKPKSMTRDDVMAAIADAPLIEALASYRAATTTLYNLLLKDNDGEPIAALGALSLFRIKCEQGILDQVRAHAKTAKRRSDGRGRDSRRDA
jgi:hypothetical protein